MRLLKIVGTLTLTLMLLALVAALLPSSAATAESGGIIKPVKNMRLISATNYMATDVLSVFVSAPAFIGDFGSIQYQVNVHIPDDEILGPRVVTITPQFSIQPIASGSNCDSVTQWFDGSVYQQVYADGIPIVWDPLPVGARTIGSEIIGFEVQALGNCTRLKITIGATNVTATVTADGRAINRQ